jgi:hypothetical protein
MIVILASPVKEAIETVKFALVLPAGMVIFERSKVYVTPAARVMTGGITVPPLAFDAENALTEGVPSTGAIGLGVLAVVVAGVDAFCESDMVQAAEQNTVADSSCMAVPGVPATGVGCWTVRAVAVATSETLAHAGAERQAAKRCSVAKSGKESIAIKRSRFIWLPFIT